MKKFKLDKRLKTNTDYYTESDTAFIIRKIGTDDTSKVTVKVEGVPCAEIVTDFAPLYATSTNRLDLFDLKDLYIVVPPDKNFRFDGTSGKYVRIQGEILRLGPGEALPASYAGRYTEQGKKFWSYQKDSPDSATSVAAKSASTVLEFTCPTGERWKFPSYLMALYASASQMLDFTTRILKQDEPLDNLINDKTDLGIDQYATPYPPSDTYGEVPFTLEQNPIELEPGQVLKIQAFNTSASAITLQTSSKVLIVGIQEYL